MKIKLTPALLGGKILQDNITPISPPKHTTKKACLTVKKYISFGNKPYIQCIAIPVLNSGSSADVIYIDGTTGFKQVTISYLSVYELNFLRTQDPPQDICQLPTTNNDKLKKKIDSGFQVFVNGPFTVIFNTLSLLYPGKTRWLYIICKPSINYKTDLRFICSADTITITLESLVEAVCVTLDYLTNIIDLPRKRKFPIIFTNPHERTVIVDIKPANNSCFTVDIIPLLVIPALSCKRVEFELNVLHDFDNMTSLMRIAIEFLDRRLNSSILGKLIIEMNVYLRSCDEAVIVDPREIVATVVSGKSLTLEYKFKNQVDSKWIIAWENQVKKNLIPTYTQNEILNVLDNAVPNAGVITDNDKTKEYSNLIKTVNIEDNLIKNRCEKKSNYTTPSSVHRISSRKTRSISMKTENDLTPFKKITEVHEILSQQSFVLTCINEFVQLDSNCIARFQFNLNTETIGEKDMQIIISTAFIIAKKGSDPAGPDTFRLPVSIILNIAQVSTDFIIPKYIATHGYTTINIKNNSAYQLILRKKNLAGRYPIKLEYNTKNLNDSEQLSNEENETTYTSDIYNRVANDYKITCPFLKPLYSSLGNFALQEKITKNIKPQELKQELLTCHDGINIPSVYKLHQILYQLQNKSIRSSSSHIINSDMKITEIKNMKYKQRRSDTSKNKLYSSDIKTISWNQDTTTIGSTNRVPHRFDNLSTKSSKYSRTYTPSKSYISRLNLRSIPNCEDINYNSTNSKMKNSFTSTSKNIINSEISLKRDSTTKDINENSEKSDFLVSDTSINERYMVENQQQIYDSKYNHSISEISSHPYKISSRTPLFVDAVLIPPESSSIIITYPEDETEYIESFILVKPIKKLISGLITKISLEDLREKDIQQINIKFNKESDIVCYPARAVTNCLPSDTKIHIPISISSEYIQNITIENPKWYIDISTIIAPQENTLQSYLWDLNNIEVEESETNTESELHKKCEINSENSSYEDKTIKYLKQIIDSPDTSSTILSQLPPDLRVVLSCDNKIAVQELDLLIKQYIHSFNVVKNSGTSSIEIEPQAQILILPRRLTLNNRNNILAVIDINNCPLHILPITSMTTIGSCRWFCEIRWQASNYVHIVPSSKPINSLIGCRLNYIHKLIIGNPNSGSQGAQMVDAQPKNPISLCPNIFKTVSALIVFPHSLADTPYSLIIAGRSSIRCSISSCKPGNYSHTVLLHTDRGLVNMALNGVIYDCRVRWNSSLSNIPIFETSSTKNEIDLGLILENSYSKPFYLTNFSVLDISGSLRMKIGAFSIEVGEICELSDIVIKEVIESSQHIKNELTKLYMSWVTHILKENKCCSDFEIAHKMREHIWNVDENDNVVLHSDTEETIFDHNKSKYDDTTEITDIDNPNLFNETCSSQSLEDVSISSWIDYSESIDLKVNKQVFMNIRSLLQLKVESYECTTNEIDDLSNDELIKFISSLRKDIALIPYKNSDFFRIPPFSALELKILPLSKDFIKIRDDITAHFGKNNFSTKISCQKCSIINIKVKKARCINEQYYYFESINKRKSHSNKKFFDTKGYLVENQIISAPKNKIDIHFGLIDRDELNSCSAKIYLDSLAKIENQNYNNIWNINITDNILKLKFNKLNDEFRVDSRDVETLQDNELFNCDYNIIIWQNSEISKLLSEYSIGDIVDGINSISTTLIHCNQVIKCLYENSEILFILDIYVRIRNVANIPEMLYLSD